MVTPLEVVNCDLKFLRNKIMSNVKSDKVSEVTVIKDDNEIRQMIYIVRNQQVMLDSDLAALYQVETRVLNQAVRRNSDRFPERFCFQLTKDEYTNLKSQIVISSLDTDQSNGYGGRRKLPLVFTEQGIAMLSSVLRSRTAIEVSIRIMDVFVEMRHFIANNATLFERISAVELKQLKYQKQTNEKFKKVFEYIDDHSETEQKIFSMDKSMTL